MVWISVFPQSSLRPSCEWPNCLDPRVSSSSLRVHRKEPRVWVYPWPTLDTQGPNPSPSYSPIIFISYFLLQISVCFLLFPRLFIGMLWMIHYHGFVPFIRYQLPLVPSSSFFLSDLAVSLAFLGHNNTLQILDPPMFNDSFSVFFGLGVSSLVRLRLLLSFIHCGTTEIPWQGVLCIRRSFR